MKLKDGQKITFEDGRRGYVLNGFIFIFNRELVFPTEDGYCVSMERHITALANDYDEFGESEGKPSIVNVTYEGKKIWSLTPERFYFVHHEDRDLLYIATRQKEKDTYTIEFYDPKEGKIEAVSYKKHDVKKLVLSKKWIILENGECVNE